MRILRTHIFHAYNLKSFLKIGFYIQGLKIQKHI